MPTRRSVLLILVFWLGVTGYVVHRDVWPVLFASGPPSIAIDLADEAAQNIPIRWVVSWNGKPVGKLVTQMKYVEEDDTFRFTNTYKQLRLEILRGAALFVPDFVTVVRVTRDGNLREQSAEGKLELHVGDLKFGEATAKLSGTVTDRQLIARFDASYGLAGAKPETMSKMLDPVPVPEGQPLNPMQPVNRIANVRPGRRWAVYKSDPLMEAAETAMRQMGLPVPDEKKTPLLAEVLSGQRELDWHGHVTPCWVIEYRRDEPEVRTWVRIADGKVLKQEAFKKGESLTIVREE